MDMVESGLDLRGKNNGLGFFFVYELLNGTLKMTMLPEDTPHMIGSALLRILSDDAISAAQGVTGQNQQLAILRIMAEHPDIASQMPQFEDKRKLKLPSLAGLDIFQTHVKNAINFIKSKLGDVDLNKLGLNVPPPYKPDVVVEGAPAPSEDTVNFRVGRIWITPRVTDFNCEQRQVTYDLPPFLRRLGNMFTPEDVAAFAEMPLRVIGIDKYIEMKSLSARRLPPVNSKSPLEVMLHPSSRSHIARSSVSRLEQDIADFASDENSNLAPVLAVVGSGEGISGPNLDVAITHMQSLINALESLKGRDSVFVREGIQEVVESTNGRGQLLLSRGNSDVDLLKHGLAIKGGVESSVVSTKQRFTLCR
jgi:hypothetical protein